MGERYAEKIGVAVAIPVRGATVLCTPLIWLLEHITAPLTKGGKRPVTDESEIKLLTVMGYQEGLIEDDEVEMIDRVFRLNDLKSADIMTPRVAITYLPGDAILQEIQDEIIESQVHYVPDTERTDRLIKTFQSLREHLMVVVDEYGGVSGVVTLEDTLEVLTGEIVDETDRNVDLQAFARQRQKRILRRSGFRKVKSPPRSADSLPSQPVE